VCECVGAVESGARSSSQAIETAVPGRSETPVGAALFSLPRRTAVSKASAARHDKDRDKDSVTSDLPRLAWHNENC
jgi:hypothetical protein